MEISFHIPNSNTQFVGDENCPPAQVSFLLPVYSLTLQHLFHFTVSVMGTICIGLSQ